MGLKKLITGLLSLFILINFSLVSINAAGSSLDAAIDYTTKIVTVTGASSAGEGQRIMVLASDSEKNIKYLDQGKTGAGGSIAFSFPIPDAANNETYSVRVWGGGISEMTASFTYKESSPSNSTISPTAASFDRYKPADIKVAMTLNGNTLKAVKNGQAELVKNTDYTVDGSNVTLKKEYIASVAGTQAQLTFVFSAGNDQKLAIAYTGAAEGSIGAAIDNTTKIVTVTGFSPAGEGQRIMVLVADSEGNIKYLNQGKTGAEGSISFSFPVPDAVNNETYKVRVWGDRVSEMTALFTYKESSPSNSAISPATANFDRYKPADIKVAMTLNGNTLKAVKNGQTGLVKNTDYTVDGSNVTLKKEYIASLAGTQAQLTFVFSAGNDQTLTINISDSKPSEPSNPQPGNQDSQQAQIPVKEKDGSSKIDLKPSMNEKTQSAEAKVDDKLLDKAFELAEPDKDGVKKVNLKIEESKGAREYSLELTAGKISKDTKKQVISIETPFGAMKLTENMLSGRKETPDSKVRLIIRKADNVEIAGDRPVIEVMVTIDGKVIPWNNPDSPVTVSVPYSPAKEELKNPEYITVWYIDGEGNATAIPSGKYDAASGRVVFTTTHFSKYAIAYVKKTFKDIAKYTWAVNSIEVLASKGIARGVTEEIFKPGENITRGEYLMWLVNTLGLTAKFDSNFDDVGKNEKYYEAIGIAKQLNITSGVGGNKFNPSKQITRQDLMVLTAKALKAAKLELEKGTPEDMSKFLDASKVAKYAVNDVSAMIRSGIITGDGKNINPVQNATRAEAAVILYKLYLK